MIRLPPLVLLISLLATTSNVVAAPDSTWTNVLGGRFESFVSVEEDSPGFRWNNVARSPEDRTRFMFDLRGEHYRFGSYYFKTAANWNDVERDVDAVEVRFEQGDYVWHRPTGIGNVGLTAYINERRYFVNSLGARLLDNDAVSKFEFHAGVRSDLVSEGGAGRIALLGAAIDDGSDRRGLVLARASWAGRAPVLRDVSAGTGVRHVSGGPEGDHIVFEATGAWLSGNGGGVFASFKQAHPENDSALPASTMDAIEVLGGEWLPDNSVFFAEVNTGKAKTSLGNFNAIYRLGAVGAEYTDPLTGVHPGMVTTKAGIYWNHNRYAVDGHVAYESWRRKTTSLQESERFIVHSRASLLEGSEGMLRVLFEKNHDSAGEFHDQSFVHARWSRHTRTLTPALHILVGNIDRGEYGHRFAAETRFNVTAMTSLYARLIINELDASNDDLYLRIEVRPLDHVVATFGFGRSFVGDDSYVLEDLDIGRSGEADRVYTVTVRGDF